MALVTYKWSIKEWHKLIESGVLEGKSVELLDGEIIKMSPEGIPHSYTNDSVVKYLRNILANLADVKESHPITLANSEPEPDIAIVRLPETIYKQHHPYPEDIYWLIEISNKTLKIDREEKSKIYARNNIAEYWIIDLVNNKLIVHTEPRDSKYTQINEYKTGAIAPRNFPNINIELDRLFLF